MESRGVLLEDWQVQAVRDLVAERCGFYLGEPHMRYLQMRIGERMIERGTTFTRYLEELRGCRSGDGELQTLLERLCIYETSFFRDPAEFDALRDYVLPVLAREARQQHRRRIRLVSAGCSTGQEAYSMAMVVREFGIADFPAPVEIAGFDLSARAIERARRGWYSEREVASLPPWRRTLHFRRDGEGYTVVPELRDLVRFHQANLAEGIPFTQVDLIFCRNVLIYLDRPTRFRVMRGLIRSLRLGGFLVVGGADSVSPHRELLDPVRTHGTLLYRRARSERRSRTAARAAVPVAASGTQRT